MKFKILPLEDDGVCDACFATFWQKCAADDPEPAILLPRAEKNLEGYVRVDHLAEHLRQRADEFRRMAETITEEHTRDSFLELARSYDTLAEAEEHE
jgi:hypothetical protein